MDEARRRQEDERIVLESIYGNDVKEAIAPKSWKVWKPLDVVVRLKPAASSGKTDGKIYVSLDLHVKCQKNYPLYSSPHISLINVKGVAMKDVEKLKELLQGKAAEMKGNEVIMELCQMVQEFLYEHNKPPEGSFFEGMMRQQAAVEHERKRERLQSEQRERDEVVALERIREEKLKWKEAGDFDETVDMGNNEQCDIIECIDGTRKRLKRSALMYKRRSNDVSICTEWSAADCSTGRELFLTEWNFVRSTKARSCFTRDFSQKLNTIEEQMNMLISLTNLDQRLCPYEVLAVQKNKLANSGIDVRVVYGQAIKKNDDNLTSVPQIEQFENDMTLLTRLATEILFALKYLSERKIGHYDLNLNNIWVSGRRHFRVSDYILRAHLSKLYSVFIHNGEKNTAIESNNMDAQSDLNSLADIMENFRNLRSVKTNGVFAQSLNEFANACRNASTVESLLEHPFLHQDHLHVLFPPTVSGGQQGNDYKEVAQSRLQNEFIFIELLGKGGFGDVMLAKNKLDGNDYAIKRIPLDPKDERFSRKVTREAKLFSKLTHPNVVRYYSAWIEYAPSKKNSVDTLNTVNGDTMSADKYKGEDSLLPSNLRGLEKVARKLAVDSTAEWTTSFQCTVTEGSQPSRKHDVGPIETIFSATLPSAVDDSEFEILFEGNDEIDEEESSPVSTEFSNPSNETEEMPFKILFIQMEYCEKSTLKSMIDGIKLIKNPRLVWRLFREILLGLQYIHQEGMIHRDIKPLNILIDGNDRAKIGDFGLATQDFVSKDLLKLSDNDMKFSSLTKDIGTALYIAPELTESADYTTKIDVYSLGIVLFEMFYRPLLPGMERIMTLKTLRNSAVFPNDFATAVPELHQRTAKRLIKWMLEGKPEDRPSVQNLLDSELIPVVDIEENDFQKMFCHALRNSSGRLHQWIMDTLAANALSPAADYLYDRNACPGERLALPRLRAVEYVRGRLSEVCSLHAFIPFDSHSFAPYTDKTTARLENAKLRICRVVDENGHTIILPYDLRRTFARFCVRNGVNRLKRYAYGKVYSRSDALGSTHPMERMEFAIDSVGPSSSSHMLTADLLCVIVDAARHIKGISSQNWGLLIGHRGLIVAAALYLGLLDDTTHNKILNVLYNITTSNKLLTREQKIERLRVGSEILYNQANSLLNILEGNEHTYEDLQLRMEPLINSRDERIKCHVSDALNDLTNVICILKSFIDDINEHVLYDGTVCYRPWTYSDGLMFQLQVLISSKQGPRPVILGAGGRYDKLLGSERHAHDPIPPNPLCAVGCSLAVDVIAHFCATQPSENPTTWCQALVCSTSDKFSMATVSLVKQLWAQNISADVLHDPIIPMQIGDLIEHCADKKINALLIVYAEDEVLVRIGETDLGKLTVDEVIEKMEHYANHARTGSGSLCFSRSISHSPVRHASNYVLTAASMANLNVRYALSEKPAANTRKRIEAQVRLCLQRAVTAVAPLTVVDVVVTDLPADGVRLIASLVDRNSTLEELSEAFSSATKQFNKFKKEYARVQEVIEPLFHPKNSSPIVIFSRQASSNGYYKFLL